VLGLCSRAQLAAFALLTALRQGARSQSTWGAARPAAKSCAPRRPPRGIDSARYALPCQCLGEVDATLRAVGLPWNLHADAQRGVWAPSRERTARRAGSGGRARSAPQRLTSRSLFERSEQRERSEFCVPPGPSTAANPWRSQGRRSRVAFLAPGSLARCLDRGHREHLCQDMGNAFGAEANESIPWSGRRKLPCLYARNLYI
jgi:hypothetical protein